MPVVCLRLVPKDFSEQPVNKQTQQDQRQDSRTRDKCPEGCIEQSPDLSREPSEVIPEVVPPVPKTGQPRLRRCWRWQRIHLRESVADLLRRKVLQLDAGNQPVNRAGVVELDESVPTVRLVAEVTVFVCEYERPDGELFDDETSFLAMQTTEVVLHNDGGGQLHGVQMHFCDLQHGKRAVHREDWVPLEVGVLRSCEQSLLSVRVGACEHHEHDESERTGENAHQRLLTESFVSSFIPTLGRPTTHEPDWYNSILNI